MSLQRTDRDSQGTAAARFGQMNRRPTHAAADVQQVLSSSHFGKRGEPLGQLQLGRARRFVGFPIAVMDVRPPQEPVKRRRKIVVAANHSLLNVGAGDHVAVTSG